MKKFEKEKELKKLDLKQKRNKYIKYGTIGLSCLVLIVSIILFTFALFESKSPSYTLIHGEVDSAKDVNIIGIYKGEQKVDEVPAKDTGWEFDHADCTNNATASWDNTDWLLKLSLNTKTKCTLYFIEHIPTAVEYLRSINSSSLVTDGTTDNNLRYVGSNPNNYIRFNNELWRIIGVMNNIENDEGKIQSLVKIRKNEPFVGYSWDTSPSEINYGYGVNEWSQADLMQELNNDYLGSVTVGTDGKWYTSSNNAKWRDKPQSTINAEFQFLIETVVWKLGSPSNNSGTYDTNYENVTTITSYLRERANTTGKVCTSGNSCTDSVIRTSSWTGKIGLIYPSDFGYATAGGSNTSRSTCLSSPFTQNGWYSLSDCSNNDWLKTSYTQWTLSPFAGPAATHVYNIHTNGYVDIDPASSGWELYPTVFLKSDVSITGGTGTQADPYTIRM